MNLDNHKRSVLMHCPSCGNTLLETLVGIEEATELIKCPSCSYEMTKDELINGNAENLSVNAQEMAKEALPDIAREIRKQLQAAFKNSKNIKFK